MKGFLEEYGLIIVVVAVILLMLLFGKSGYAKSIQDAILGSADHIVETGENITKKDKITASDTIDIEGTKYVVLEERENNQALVMTADSIDKLKFQSGDTTTTTRSDGQNMNTYEDSEIDNYLENEWYKSLSPIIKDAIHTTDIKQVSYDRNKNQQETGYNGQMYNTISRHVFLPSVSEIGKVVDVKNPDKIKAFLNGESARTRDSYQFLPDFAVFANGYLGDLGNGDVRTLYDVRPAFVIDLSQVNYKVTGHTDYK